MIDQSAHPVLAAAKILAHRERLAGLDDATELSAIAGGGSNREFFRLAGGSRAAVVLHQPGGGRELDSYVEIARILARHGVGAPEIYAADREAGIVLMEDLGDVHLEDALSTASPAEASSLYRQSLDILVDLETTVTDSLARGNLLGDSIFDEKTLLGETEYFMREFVEGFCPVPVPGSWEEERRFLAAALARERRVFMHRDFQSRNIMLRDGRLRIVDFQTAHRGPGLYDAASLLKDAYHPVNALERRTLLEAFHAKLRARGAPEERHFGEFYEAFTLAGVQRNLQALAAFVKLGTRMGKPRFLDSIPNGIDLLEEGVRESRTLPGLETMVAAIRERMRPPRAPKSP
ncbi:MAG: phosphotransferase [Candidatus Krumholzibacteria bacterium]|nr:phosphotransferase [Candidatus Krumholzibacteria bacterium]